MASRSRSGSSRSSGSSGEGEPPLFAAAAAKAKARAKAAAEKERTVAEGEEAGVLSVTALTQRIRGALDGFGRVSVEGELSGFKRAASGHLYFQLKDHQSVISCAVWKSQVARAVKVPPGRLADGLKLVCRGKLDVYGPRGGYTLIVDRVEERGLGALLVELEKLKEELRAHGWFDRARPLPKLPRTVGLVTSKGGAALRDFLRTRSLRWPLYPVRLVHSAVQGAGAAQEIARAIRALDASGVDVICVCRGGGSLEDLWCFNDRAVAEAVWESSVPVVSGVGHETDWTLCDFVADHRAHTPTDAAQATIPERAAFLEALERQGAYLSQALGEQLARRERRLAELLRSRVLRSAAWILDERLARVLTQGVRLKGALRTRLSSAETRLERATRSLQHESPGLRLERSEARLERAGPRLARAAEVVLERADRRLSLAERSLASISPFAVLARGYSITRRADGAPVRTVEGLAAGETLETLVAGGRIRSTVDELDAGATDELAGEPAGEDRS